MNVGDDFHPEAEIDFTNIWDFRAQDSPDSADRDTDEILNRLEGLVAFPFKGHERRDLTERPLRFIRIYEYLIAYAPNERPLFVVAILH